MSKKLNQHLSQKDNVVQFDEFSASTEQESLESKFVNDNSINSQQLMPNYASLQGHFLFDGSKGLFLLDEVSCTIVGLKDHHQWYSIDDVIMHCSSFDIARFAINTTSASLGDIVFERIYLVSGPYKGETFIIQGTVLERDDEGKALWLTGYISHIFSPYSEFLAREMSGDGIFMWEGVDANVVCSASMLDMLGYSEHELPNEFLALIYEIIHPDDNDVLLVMRQFILSEQYGNYFESCLRLKHKKGHYIWTICRGLIQERDLSGIAIKGVGSITDINLVKDSFENIKLMLFTDSLTGLHNRNYFQQNCMRYESHKLQPISVIFVDVSGLKLTNDILGHSYGDYLLTKTCEVIKEAVLNATGIPVNTEDYESSHHDDVNSTLPEHFFGQNNQCSNGDYCDVSTKTFHSNAQALKDQQAIASQQGPHSTKAQQQATKGQAVSQDQDVLQGRHGTMQGKAAALEPAKMQAQDGQHDLPSHETDKQSLGFELLAGKTELCVANKPLQKRESLDGCEPLDLENNCYSVKPELAPILELDLDSDPLLATSNDDIGQTDPLTFEDFSKVAIDFVLSDEIYSDYIELMRLAGDEFLLILPQCPESVIERILIEIIKLKDELNYHNQNFVPVVDRPVPLCFGIGSATYGEKGFTDTALKQVIERADERMQDCKEQLRKHDYKILKEYFELKKGRPVSMRDERRANVLTEEERSNIRRNRINNMMS